MVQSVSQSASRSVSQSVDQSTIEGSTRVRAINFYMRRNSDEKTGDRLEMLLYAKPHGSVVVWAWVHCKLHASIVFIRSQEVLSKHAPAWPHKKLVAQWRIHDLYIRGAT